MFTPRVIHKCALPVGVEKERGNVSASGAPAADINLRTHYAKSLLVAATLSIVATAGHAATLFQNTANTGINGNCTFECFGHIGAENFSLTDAALITNFSFDVVKFSSGDIAGTTIAWGLHADAPGTPGAAIISGTAGLDTQSLGTAGNYDRLRLNVDIVDTSVAAGNYWLSLALTVPSGGSRIYWLRATDGDSLSAVSRDGGSSWSTPYASGTSTGLAFAINGTDVATVPLPAGLPLLLAGLGAIAMVRRKAA